MFPYGRMGFLPAIRPRGDDPGRRFFAGLQLGKLIVMLGLVGFVYRDGIRAGVPSRLMVLVAAATALHLTFAAAPLEIDLWFDRASAVCFFVPFHLCLQTTRRHAPRVFLLSSALVTAICLLWK